MFTILIVAIFCWLFITALKLIFALTFGAVKVLGIILCIIALPTLIGCLLLASGAVLLLPLIIIGAACGVLRHSEG